MKCRLLIRFKFLNILLKNTHPVYATLNQKFHSGYTCQLRSQSTGDTTGFEQLQGSHHADFTYHLLRSFT
ncbi:MAG: hypothetical protein A2340_02740 [Lentisphaerae bacterium RIFOXYB12_FULL_60_10]|nr:MAG: hypothetical protein A2340_02740 [Lentisphaerae bacterium RIFOXYB12_FULL_60_10]